MSEVPLYGQDVSTCKSTPTGLIPGSVWPLMWTWPRCQVQIHSRFRGNPCTLEETPVHRGIEETPVHWETTEHFGNLINSFQPLVFWCFRSMNRCTLGETSAPPLYFLVLFLMYKHEVDTVYRSTLFTTRHHVGPYNMPLPGWS